MWLDTLFTNKIAQDIVATVITAATAILWLRLVDALAHRGLIEARLSRKIIHIGTGPLFVLCWNLFSASPWSRYLAALVPLLITVQFFLVGIGVVKDPAAVAAMTRTGNPREILRGPLFYGIVFVICTILFWLDSPAGILALMMMCGGDGLADVVGRRWGQKKLPFSRSKSWVGSAAMFLGSYAFGFGFLALFTALGYFQLNLGVAAAQVAGITLIATAVESLPLQDIDNVTVTAAVVLLSLWWL